jgi:hypothetical protein
LLHLVEEICTRIVIIDRGVKVADGTLEELEPNITAYRKAWKEAGHPGNGKVFLRSPVYVYFASWGYLVDPTVARFHWGRIAINP